MCSKLLSRGRNAWETAEKEEATPHNHELHITLSPDSADALRELQRGNAVAECELQLVV